MFGVRRCLVVLLPLVLAACAAAGLGKAERINQLHPGMTRAEVAELLGEPSDTEVEKGRTILRYSLHQYYKGWVPHYLVFATEADSLISWSADEEEYQQNQQRMQAMFGELLEAGGSYPPLGPSDPQLVQWISGQYFSFSGGGLTSGGTSRQLSLCSDGRFHGGTESGYSESGAWGTAAQSDYQGRWAIQGNQQSGRITLSFSDGSQETLDYTPGPERGCFDFSNVTYCYQSEARC